MPNPLETTNDEEHIFETSHEGHTYGNNGDTTTHLDMPTQYRG